MVQRCGDKLDGLVAQGCYAWTRAPTKNVQARLPQRPTGGGQVWLQEMQQWRLFAVKDSGGRDQHAVAG